MAMHTKNVLSEPRATLLVSEVSDSPLGAARISVMGSVELIENDVEKARAAQAYLERHPDSQQWAGFGDFGFFRMLVKDVYFVGGFGVMGWIKPDEYSEAKPDPIAGFAKDIIAHMNEDHVDSMVLLAKSQHGIDAETAMMTGIDRSGFNMMVKADDGVRGVRIAFPRAVASANDTRKVLVEMVKAAR
jgi:putative heme iron utilization protein